MSRSKLFQPAEVKEIKTFLEYARRKDAKRESNRRLPLPPSSSELSLIANGNTEVTIKKSVARKAGSGAAATKYKFKLRCSRYLYTFCLADSDKAEKLRQSLPPSTSRLFLPPPSCKRERPDSGRTLAALKVNDVDSEKKSKK